MVEERTISYALRVKLPETVVPNKGFKECCYDNLVLANISSSLDYENDYYGLFFKRQTNSDTCDFVLVDQATNTDYPITNNTYGEYTNFGNVAQPDVKIFIVHWKKVLQLLGEGIYFIRKDITIVGLPFVELSNTFDLRQFSNEIANHSVRFDSFQDGYLEHIDVDFKGLKFKTSIRMKGFFGRREPDYTQENDVYRNEKVVQNNMMQENEYQFQAGTIPICITDELFDFLMFGNDLFLNDYNLNNHDYKYRKFAVVYRSNKGTKYFIYDRNAQINMTFEDRYKKKRKINC